MGVARVNTDIVNVVIMLFSLAASALLGLVLRELSSLRKDVTDVRVALASLEGRMDGKPGDRRKGFRDE